ncbi:retrovirus-related pol polyprotein from transposon TNT 1-94 [Tanacetum coccineum]|uniref:Retrovirus-related pol polyprotein from transposon TNT 1-94 n=1 Tax=Tanacetum coccineum TaxID=301880 RepID=A0ABQ4WP89_9ASTR
MHNIEASLTPGFGSYNICNICAYKDERGRVITSRGPKLVFRDDSSGDIEGYGLVNCNGITFTRVAYVNGLKHNLISISQLCDANYKILFTKTQGTIYNQNDKVVLISPRRRDVYVIDMSSFNKESNACFFAKVSPSVNWLWHKRLTQLNFKNINDLPKHNLVSGLSFLTLSNDKNCSACEKGKHHRDHSKQRDYFPSTNEYSRYTWVFCLKKKSDAADCIMSFIRKMENLNEVRVKELRSDNGTEFRNHKLEEFCDEKEAVNTACYIQNRSIIVKRHRKTSYDVFRGRSPDIGYFYVFGCPVHIHNHRDHLGKFDEKADDGFFLGYSLVAKAFRVFNIRRQEMKETVHVTFSEDDEAISQSSIEGDAINFNENRSFPDDEFLEPRNPPKFTKADNHPALNEPDQTVSVDHFEPTDLFESAEPQINVIIEPIRDDQPLPTIPPSVKFWATAKANTVNGERQLQALVDKKRVIITESSIRSDLHLADVGGIDCLPTATIFEELAWMGPQKKQSKRKQRKETNVPQDEIHHDDSVPIPSNDPLLSILDLEKAKDAQAKEIAGLKKRVQKLERKNKSRTTGLQRLRKVGESSRVESSEDKESLGAQEDASKQRRIKIVDETQVRLDDAEMFDIDDLHDDEVIVDMAVGEKQEKSAKIDERQVSTGIEDSDAPTIPFTTTDEGVIAAKIDEITPTSAPTIVIDELTLAQTLIEIKAAKPKAVTTAATTTTTRPKARGVVVQEPSEFRTTTSSPQAS